MGQVLHLDKQVELTENIDSHLDNLKQLVGM